MNQQAQQKANGAWVRLHLERQSENSAMPASIVGFLSEETPGSYVLTKTIEYQEDEDTYEKVAVEVPTMLLVSRTYVWACEILGERHDTEEPYSGEGGLG
jgi:hypothetical protein